jgi:hypothetical protein
LKHKKREAIVEPFIKNHEIVEDLKSAYDDVEEVSNEGEGNNKNKDSSDNSKDVNRKISKNQNNQTTI